METMDGLRALSKMIPIGKIYDHGDSSTRSIAAGSKDYKDVAGRNRVIVKPASFTRETDCLGGVWLVLVIVVILGGSETARSPGLARQQAAAQS